MGKLTSLSTLLVLFYCIWKNTQCCNFNDISVTDEELMQLDENGLLCAIQNVTHRAKVSLRLCDIYLQRDNLVGAYTYGLDALLTSPNIAEGYECLAKANFAQGNRLRAAFYSQLAVTAPSIRDKHRHSVSYMFGFLVEHDPENVWPVHTCTDVETRLNKWQRLVLISLNGSSTLLTAYSTAAGSLPSELSGPYIIGYESFLANVEDMLQSCSGVTSGTDTASTKYPVGSHLPSADKYNGPPYYAITQASPMNSPLSEEFPPLLWSLSRTLVLFYTLDTSFLFSDNLLGLSDALNRLGIPNRITQCILTSEDFMTIEPSGPPLGLAERPFVAWNFEKNPKLVQMGVEETGFGSPDECGRDEARYSRKYINKAYRTWESISANMIKWRSEVGRLHAIAQQGDAQAVNGARLQVPRLVRSFFPFRYIEVAAAEMRFRDKCMEKFGTDAVLSTMDAARPIDILFVGNTNPHREEVKNAMMRLGEEHNLHVMFYMEYDLFHSALDSVVAQAKIVLSLANSQWPAPHSSQKFPNCSIFDEQDVLPTGAAANLHRIRAMLARGKVVISERSGSVIDEMEMDGLLMFADSGALPATALALLRDASARDRLERRGLQYMLEEQTAAKTSSGHPTALHALIEAVNEIASHWADDVKVDPRSTLEGLRELCSRSEAEKLDPLLWAECTCASMAIDNESFSFFTGANPVEIPSGNRSLIRGAHPKAAVMSTRPLTPLNMARTHNSSSPCHLRATSSVLVGYLMRRVIRKRSAGGDDIESSFLQVGCRESHFTHLPDNTLRECVDIVSNDPYHGPGQFSSYPHTFLDLFDYVQERHSAAMANNLPAPSHIFDVISVTLRLNSTKEDESIVSASLLSLLAPGGVLLLHNCKPVYRHEAANFSYSGDDSIYYMGYSHQMMLTIRSLRDVDSAVVNMDSGVLVATKRHNPIPLPELFQSKVTPAQSLSHIDVVVPLLTMNEVDEWLEDDQATAKFVDGDHPLYRMY